MYKVNYTKHTKQLWASEISDHFPEDAKIKKLIANENFGLLEKGTNKSSKSFAFDGLREALYYQQEVGGKINKITGYDLENDKELDRKCYCLTVTDRVASRNGYTYIRELLLQTHNHKMPEDYTNLVNNGVDVWSVKTDAFTIRSEHLSKAKKAIAFNSNIGRWRHEKRKINNPTDRKTQNEGQYLNDYQNIPTKH